MSPTSRRIALVLIGTFSVLASLLAVPVLAADSAPAQERHRPAVHFTPEKNWMNDPNGMVFHKGVYHLFFQHNPFGTSWGNMSWGHATSTDLLTWEEQPIAIERTANEAIFSGSVVVDHGNTTGFGTVDDPAMVAIYTSAYENHPSYGNRQAQSLAYSTDDGKTWTKYSGNPVLDRQSNNFRDPKVFWYDGGSPESSYWVMVAVEAVDHKAVLYKSRNLKDWDFLSDFGPANATAGVWECPDLFELPVEGDPGATKWVLVVNLNPGSVAGGSGGQYFVGDFNGTTFTSESTVEQSDMPPGEVFEDFERDSYAPWTVVNSGEGDQPGPFGTSPTAGAVPGQSPVTGFKGAKLLNSFRGGDSPVGTATSPAFEIDKPYVNLMVGGGNHPRTSDKLDNDPPAGDLLFDGFEMSADQRLADFGWAGTGDLLPKTQPVTTGGENYIGERRINTYEVAPGSDAGPTGDGRKGTLTSPEFQITRDNIAMLVGGGGRSVSDPEKLEVQLVVDGDVQRRLTGRNEGSLNWAGWDVSDLKGQTAQLRIVDEAAGGWGHLTLDHVVMTDDDVKPRSDETTVNLVVDGKVVRTATGDDSESLDLRSWNVGNLIGRQARIRVVDNHRGGWGHVLVDQVMLSDTSATDVMESYDWLDWGRDYYASVSFSNTAGRRVMLGWMSNWDYAGQTPTSAWRSAMSLPREVSLAQTAKGPRLVQKVVREVADIEQEPVYDHAGGVPNSEVVAKQQVARIDTTLIPGDSGETGITVLGAGDTSTRIGYDADEGRLFVDRRNSGDVGFSAKFASRDSAPVTLHQGRLDLQIYIDKASVEVFTGDRRVTITDLVFPPEEADEIRAFAASNGSVESMKVRPLERTMFRSPPADTTTSVGATPSRLIVGQPQDVEVTVAGGDTVPTGSVSLERDGEALGDPVALDDEGQATVTLRGDEVGTTEFRATYSGDKDHAASSAAFSVLVSKPVSSLAAVSNAGSNGWYGKGAKLTLTGSEGVKALQYRIGEGDWTTYEGPVTLDAGTYAIDHRAQDDNPPWGDVSSLPVKVDLTDPTVTDKLVDRTVTLTASDEESGVAGVQYRLDGGDWLAYTAPVTVDGAAHTVDFRATDVAGNQGATGSRTIEKVVDPPAGPAPVVEIAPVVIGVPKVGALLASFDGVWNQPDLTFTRQWLRDGVPISNATAQTYRLTSQDVGKRITVQVTASKAGLTPGTAISARTAKVVKTSSQTDGWVSATSVKSGTEVTLRATVTAAGVVPDGKVYVYYRGTKIRSLTLSDGTASSTFHPAKKGTQTFTFSYQGSSGVTSSKDTVKVRVR